MKAKSTEEKISQVGGTLIENASADGRINALSVNGQIVDWATIWKASLINPDMSGNLLTNVYRQQKIIPS